TLFYSARCAQPTGPKSALRRADKTFATIGKRELQIQRHRIPWTCLFIDGCALSVFSECNRIVTQVNDSEAWNIARHESRAALEIAHARESMTFRMTEFGRARPVDPITPESSKKWASLFHPLECREDETFSLAPLQIKPDDRATKNNTPIPWGRIS